MDFLPLLKSKLIIPEIPDKAIFSQRIKDFGIADFKAAVITAPAGFGKTTAVILSLENHREHIKWYRMEKDDAFFSLFYAHLIDILFPGQDSTTLDCIRSLTSYNNIAEEYLLQNALICQDAWSFYADASHPVYLVFDDFQNVLTNPLISESIRYFIANMPDCIRIIVMSRMETGIITGKMVYDKQYALIGEADLRFTEEEAVELLADKYQMNLTEGQIKKLLSYSEGWIAGLTMICHMDHPKPLHDDGVNPETLTYDQAGLFRYFFKEFLSDMEPTMLMNLARIAILPDFSCEDITAVFQIENAAEIVEWLEKGNVYIQKFNTVPIKYRFHALFRRELEAYLSEYLRAEELKNLRLAVAKHYEKEGDARLAVHFYIASGHIDEARKLASDIGIRVVHSATPEKVIPILMEFPDYYVQTDPYLLFFRGTSLIGIQSKESFQCFLNALLLFKERRDSKLMMDALGMTIPISFVKNNYTYIRSAISLIPKVRVMLGNKNGRKKLLLTAFMSTAWSDRLKLGTFLCKILERMDPVEPVWEYCFHMVKGVVLYRRGLLEEAFRNSKIIMNHNAALSSDQWKSVGLSCGHNAPWLMGDVEESQKYLVEFASLAEKYDSAFSHGYALRLSAYLKYQTLDFSGMTELMQDSAEAFIKDGNPTMACVVNTARYLWEAEQNVPEPYAQMAESELKRLESLNPGQGFRELCQTITGALHKECGKYAEAETLLAEAYHISRKKKAMQSMCGTLIHLADLYYRTGKSRREDICLSRFGRTVAKFGYEYFREMNYTTLVRVCARCMEKDIEPDKMYRMIARYFGAEGADRMAGDPGAAAASPHIFIAGHSPFRHNPKTVKVTLFGDFRMSVDDICIEGSVWKTRKTSGILKYILASSGKAVTRETLAAVFWPESDAKAASTSLRAALYELRKTLAQYGMAFESENALLVENKNGFMISENNLVDTDVNEFNEMYRMYKAGNWTSEERKEYLIKMLEIYKGEFLEGVPGDEGIPVERERYQSMAVEVSYDLVSVYMGIGELDLAEPLLLWLMQIDPIDEAACGLLIEVYKKTDQSKRANSLKRQFEKRFESEMGLKPNLKSRRSFV